MKIQDELNNDILKDLHKKKIVRIPGGWVGAPGHGMLYELSLEGEDVVFKIVNTGEGIVGLDEQGQVIDNHLSQESPKLTRYAPLIAYRFPAARLKEPKKSQYAKNRYLLLTELLDTVISPNVAPLWDNNKAVDGNILYQNIKKITQAYGAKEISIPGHTDSYCGPQHSGVCSWKVMENRTKMLITNTPAFKLNLRYHAMLDEMAGILKISGNSQDWQLLKTNPEKLALSDAVIDKINLHELRSTEHAIANISRSIAKPKNKKLPTKRIAFLTDQMGQFKQVLEKARNRKLELVRTLERNRAEEARRSQDEFERKLSVENLKKIVVPSLDFSVFKKEINPLVEKEGDKKEVDEKRQKEVIWRTQSIEGATFADKIKNLNKYLTSKDKPLTPAESVFAIEQCLKEQAFFSKNNLAKFDGVNIKPEESTEFLQAILSIIHQYNLAVSQGDRIPYAHRNHICLKLHLLAHSVASNNFSRDKHGHRNIFSNNYTHYLNERFKDNRNDPFFILLNEQQLEEMVLFRKEQDYIERIDKVIAEKDFRVSDQETTTFHHYVRHRPEFQTMMKNYSKNSLVRKIESEQSVNDEDMSNTSLAIYYYMNARNGKYPGAPLPKEMEKYSLEFDQLLLLDEIGHETCKMIEGESTDIYYDKNANKSQSLPGLYSLYHFDKESWYPISQGLNAGKKHISIEATRNVQKKLNPKRLSTSYKKIEKFERALYISKENSSTLYKYTPKGKILSSLQDMLIGSYYQHQHHESDLHRWDDTYKTFLTLEFMKTHFGLLEDPEIQLIIVQHLFEPHRLSKTLKYSPKTLESLSGYIVQSCQQEINIKPLSEQGKFLLRLRSYLLTYLHSVENRTAVGCREKLLFLDKNLNKKMQEYLKIKNPTGEELDGLESIANSLIISKSLALPTQEKLPEILEEEEITYLLALVARQLNMSDKEPTWSYDKYLEEELIFKASSRIMEILKNAALRGDKRSEDAIKQGVLPILQKLGIKTNLEAMRLDLPYLLFGDNNINLQTGVLTQAGEKQANLPSKITKHAIFEQHFGKGYVGKGALAETGNSVRFTHSDSGIKYQFSIIDPTNASIKAKLNINGKPLLYTFCDYSRKNKLDLQGLPETLFDKRFEYWTADATDNPHMFILEKQQPRYYFDLKKNTLSLVEDGKITPYVLQSNQVSKKIFPHAFNQIKNFESGRFIEVYQNSNKPDDWLIKLPRYDLSFVLKNGKWICQQKPDCYLETIFSPTRLDQLNACLHLNPLGKSDEEWVIAPRQRFRAKHKDRIETMSTLAQNEYEPLYLDRAAEIYEENDCTEANNMTKREVEVGNNPARHRLRGEERYVLYSRKDAEVEAHNSEDRSHLAYLYMGLRDHKKAYEELLKLSVSIEKPSLETFENLRRIMKSLPEITRSAGGKKAEADHSAEAIAVRQLALSILFKLQARFPEVLNLEDQEINLDDLSAQTKKFQNQRTIGYAKNKMFGECKVLSEWFEQYTDYIGIKHNIPAELHLNEETECRMLARCQEYFELDAHANVKYRYHQLKLTALLKMKNDLLSSTPSIEIEKDFIAQLDKEIALHQKMTFKKVFLEKTGGAMSRITVQEEVEVQVARPYQSPVPLKIKIQKIKNLKSLEETVFGESFTDYLAKQPPMPQDIELPSFAIESEPEHLKQLKREIDKDLLEGAEITRRELNKAEKAKIFFKNPSKINHFRIAIEKENKELSAYLEKENNEIIDFLNKAPLLGTPERLNYDLARLGRTRKTLIMADAFDLFLQNNIHYYKEKTGLSEEECRVLHEKIFSYLQEATHQQHLKRISEVLNDPSLADTEKHAKLGILLTQERAFNTWEHPDLLLFEYLDDKRLSKKQADYLASLSGSGADPYQTIQLIMGGGKSKVLNPLLALRFADGLHLAMLVVPQALIHTNYDDLSQTCHRLFGKEVHLFTFSRKADDSLEGLEKIENQFLEAISMREPIVTTPESLQSLELKYLELLDMQKPSDEERIQVIQRILLILKNRTVPIVDEVDKALSVKRQLNYTIGVGEPIEPHLCQANLALYEFLRFVPLGKETAEASLLDIATGKISPPPRTAWRGMMADLAVKLCQEATSPLKTILDKLTEEERKSLQEYLTEKYKEIPSFMMGKLEPKERDKLALYKEQICRTLPQTLLKKYNVDYGMPPEKALSEIETEVAIPYDNGEPNPRSRFANYIIAMNNTIQMHFNKPLTDSMLAAFLRPFSEKIALEKASGISGSTQKLFEDSFETPWEEVAGLKSGSPRLKEIYDRLRNNKKVKSYCLEKYILPEIRQNKKVLSSNAQSFVSLFSHRFIGFSGTDWNYRCYHPKIRCNKSVSLGTDGQTLYHLLRKKLPEIYSDEQSDTVLPEEQIMARMLETPKPGKVHAFIDLGAWGANHSNIDFVRMKEFQNKLKTNAFEFILFFENGKLQALSIKDGKIIELGQTDKKYIQEKLGVGPDKCFTYYDTPHTVGIDIAQAENARGILSIDKNTTLRDLLQAVMRMRKLSEEQQIDVLVPKAVRKFYPEIKIWNMETVLKMVVQNQIKTLSEDILVSAFHKMDDILQSKVKEKLKSTKTQQERDEILKKFKNIVYQIENRSCYDQYGSIDTERPVALILAEKKEMVEKIMAELLKDELDSETTLEQVRKKPY